MKKVILILGFGASCLWAEDEIHTLDKLIAATTRQLSAQIELKELLMEFREQKLQFELHPESKVVAGTMVATAREVAEAIRVNHLEHLFSTGYLEELIFFSSIAQKREISRP